MSEIIRKELEDLEEELNSLMTSSHDSKEEVQMAAGAGAEREPEAANPYPFHDVGGGVEVVRAGAVDRACAASPDPPYDSGSDGEESDEAANDADDEQNINIYFMQNKKDEVDCGSNDSTFTTTSRVAGRVPGRERPPDQDMAEHRSPGKFRSLFQDKTEAQRQDTYNSCEVFLARERKRRRLAGGGTSVKM